MNGLRCYLSRDEAREILTAVVNERLNPERLLGRCRSDIQVLDDSRIEVAFWGAETGAEGGEPTAGEAAKGVKGSDAAAAPATHKK